MCVDGAKRRPETWGHFRWLGSSRTIYPAPVFDPRGVLPRAAPTRRWLDAVVLVGWFPEAEVGPDDGPSNPNYPKVRRGAPRRAKLRT